LSAADVASVERLVDGVRRLVASVALRGAEVVPFGEAWATRVAVRQVVHGQVISIALSLLADFLLLLLLLRSLRFAALACIPVATAVLAVFALMGLFHMPLTIASSMFAAVGLGIGTDFAVHFVTHLQELHRRGLPLTDAITATIQATAPSILEGAVILACGLMTLQLSTMYPSRTVGGLTAIAIVMTAVATVYIGPRLAILLLQPRWRRAPFFFLFISLVVSGTARANTDPAPRRMVDVYNARALGGPVARRAVALSLLNDNQVVRRFDVVNLWRRTRQGVETLFYLEKPVGLTGTAYLIFENAADLMRVALHIPAGRGRVLNLAPELFDQGLLGSDFTYRDLRMLIPTEHTRFVLTGSTTIANRECTIIEAYSLDDHASATRYYLDKLHPFLLGADYLKADSTDHWRVVKTMRVEALEEVGGIWSATRMIMRVNDGRASLLELKTIDIGLSNIPESVFEAQSLPSLRERPGWRP
jgi:hypothetical protein